MGLKDRAFAAADAAAANLARQQAVDDAPRLAAEAAARDAERRRLQTHQFTDFTAWTDPVVSPAIAARFDAWFAELGIRASDTKVTLVAVKPEGFLAIFNLEDRMYCATVRGDHVTFELHLPGKPRVHEWSSDRSEWLPANTLAELGRSLRRRSY